MQIQSLIDNSPQDSYSQYIRNCLHITMDLDTQIQLLIDNAPQDGVTPQLIAAIAPVLSKITHKLSHHHYYIHQNPQQSWVVTILSKHTNSVAQKRVIYAFGDLKYISPSYLVGLDDHVIAIPMPVVDVLFQLVALNSVDSIVFIESPYTESRSVEIRRAELHKQIENQLKKLPPTVNIPDDIV